MADNIQAEAVVTPGATFATDDDGVAHHPYVKLEWGADNTQTKVASGASAIPIQDGGNSITVDNAALSVTGGGVEATAVRVTVASDSTGVLSVDDNGGSLTVDGTVTANAGTNLNTSLLALEAGGNLAAAAASLAILDNIVVGSEAQVDIVAALPAGTNNIGDVDVLTLPASTKTIKRAVGSLSSSGDNTAIAAPGASKVIKVISYALQGTGTVNAKFTDGAAGTQLSMLWQFQAREGVYAQPTVIPQFHFKCTANTALILNLSAAIAVAYEITYWDDDAA